MGEGDAPIPSNERSPIPVTMTGDWLTPTPSSADEGGFVGDATYYSIVTHYHCVDGGDSQRFDFIDARQPDGLGCEVVVSNTQRIVRHHNCGDGIEELEPLTTRRRVVDSPLLRNGVIGGSIVIHFHRGGGGREGDAIELVAALRSRDVDGDVIVIHQPRLENGGRGNPSEAQCNNAGCWDNIDYTTKLTIVSHLDGNGGGVCQNCDWGLEHRDVAGCYWRGTVYGTLVFTIGTIRQRLFKTRS